MRNVNAPSRHHTQYFEMMGDRAIYHDGWIASTKVMRPPWDVAGAVSQDPAGFPYELYDLTKDWTQYNNVAKDYPAKLKELENLFWVEANKYQVLPLDTSVATRAVVPRPSLAAGRTRFTWSGEITGTPNGAAPFILGVQLQGRGGDSAGRSGGHDRDPGRPVWRLRVLRAQG
jgi:hypothetical protein